MLDFDIEQPESTEQRRESDRRVEEHSDQFGRGLADGDSWLTAGQPEHVIAALDLARRKQPPEYAPARDAFLATHAPGTVRQAPVAYQAGWFSGASHVRADQLDEVDGHFGLCPRCQRHDGYVNIGCEHWFHCDKCRTKWCVGANLFSSWQDETQDNWDASAAHLAGYEIVEPLHTEAGA